MSDELNNSFVTHHSSLITHHCSYASCMAIADSGAQEMKR